VNDVEIGTIKQLCKLYSGGSRLSAIYIHSVPHPQPFDLHREGILNPLTFTGRSRGGGYTRLNPIEILLIALSESKLFVLLSAKAAASKDKL
jgi:hypothetical protein